MQRLQRLVFRTTVAFAFPTIAYFKYTAPVRTVSRLDETPASFQAAFNELNTSKANRNRMATWGFYTRQVQENPTEKKTPEESLTSLTRNIFGSNAYWLELVLSKAKENPMAVEGRVGERFGNLLCVARTPNESLWHYDHVDFNFSMFVGAYDGLCVIGFIELNDDRFEDGGSRFLLPLFLEEAARNTYVAGN